MTVGLVDSAIHETETGVMLSTGSITAPIIADAIALVKVGAIEIEPWIIVPIVAEATHDALNGTITIAPARIIGFVDLAIADNTKGVNEINPSIIVGVIADATAEDPAGAIANEPKITLGLKLDAMQVAGSGLTLILPLWVITVGSVVETIAKTVDVIEIDPKITSGSIAEAIQEVVAGAILKLFWIIVGFVELAIAETEAGIKLIEPSIVEGLELEAIELETLGLIAIFPQTIVGL